MVKLLGYLTPAKRKPWEPVASSFAFISPKMFHRTVLAFERAENAA
jgi:hypothetical protein